MADAKYMRNISRLEPPRRRVASLVRQRIERDGERLWRLDDFKGSSFAAVAQALSRLTREGVIERLSKGVYYRCRPTAFGKSRPNPDAVHHLAARRRAIFPAGLAAANLLGFTTQTPKHREVATSSMSLPRKLVGSKTLIHARRPEAWAKLSPSDAALLDLLRQSARTSELSPDDTIRKTLIFLSDDKRYRRLLGVANTEPPRVRAMLGAIGEELNYSPKMLRSLRATLNPLSRYDFGALAGLRNAQKWQAKKHDRETL